MTVRERLEEVVGFTDEVRRGDGVRLADHAPLTRVIREWIAHRGLVAARLGLASHRLRGLLAWRVRVVDDMPALGEIGRAAEIARSCRPAHRPAFCETGAFMLPSLRR